MIGKAKELVDDPMMNKLPRIYQWREISNIPESPGIYAWYYTPEITDFDLDKIIDAVRCFRKKGAFQAAEQSIRDFLETHLFTYFKQEPYHMLLTGPLKPRYEGIVTHQSGLSDALVKRLADDPIRLRTMRQILEKSTPNFASPIYIGMSEKLCTRLKRHKSLIETYREELSFSVDFQDSEIITPEEKERETDFARRICARKIPPTRLSVVVSLLDEVKSNEYVDAENVLNRLHYPLLGRN